MVKFDKDFEAITIDTESDENELIKIFEEKTDKKLAAAHSEKIIISIIAYAKSLILLKINECVKNLLLPYAKGIWLDILGYLVGCIRLAATKSKSKLKVVLYEIFTFDKTLPKGSKIETSDGQSFFETTEDLVIKAGETVGFVEIQSVEAGSLLNYGIGEVNQLVENYEFIESVENTVDCVGGSDAEKDDDYRERIAIAPEHFSVAGPEDAYKYFIKSAHNSILDCACVMPSDDVSIEVGNETYFEEDGEITTSSFKATVNYNECSVEISGTINGTVKINFPKQGELNWYILTKDGEASEEILNVADRYVSAVDKRPLTDFVKYYSAIKNEFTFSPIIYIDRDADFNTVEIGVKTALNDFFNELKTKMNTPVFASDLIKLIRNVPGTYDVDLNGFKTIQADSKTFNVGIIGDDIKFVRAK